jgi:hypothetical protein
MVDSRVAANALSSEHTQQDSPACAVSHAHGLCARCWQLQQTCGTSGVKYTGG